jgi:hypothetical protein
MQNGCHSLGPLICQKLCNNGEHFKPYFFLFESKKLLLQFKNYEEKKYNNESIDYPISKYSLD